MGLFRRRDTEAEVEAELSTMRAALEELRAELDERTTTATRTLSDELSATRTALEERATATDATLAGLRAELTTAEQRRVTDADQVSALRERLTDTQAGLDRLDERLQAIDDRFSTPLPPPPPESDESDVPAPTPDVPVGVAPAMDPAEVQALHTHLARLDERLAAVDRRVTVVSTELANQLAEISSDIEALDQAAQAAAERAARDDQDRDDQDGDDQDRDDDGIEPVIDPQLLDELRDAQLRLANEQARYQIAFRDDLARLAEQLKRR